MKKPLYTIASLIIALFISERTLDVFFDIGPFAPRPIKLFFIATALILFGIHFYKKPKS